MFKNFLVLLRPYQYTKNLFIFAPLFFHFVYTKDIGGYELFDVLFSVFLSFVLFCFLASGVYIFNDLKDIEADRAHPKKKNRPLASGAISKNTAIAIMLSFWSISFVGSWFISPFLLAVFVAYFLLNLAYSLGIKHVVIVDIFIIAIGFVLRLFAGASVGIELSHWIVIMTFLLALFLAIAKRRDDVLLASQGLQTRKNIDGYNLEFVNAAMVFMSGAILLAYILYTIEPAMPKYLYLNSVFVIFGIVRYMQLTFVENASSDPARILLKDRKLQICVLAWLISFGFFVY